MDRIELIKTWVIELELKGGVILSEKLDIGYSFGYMIIGGKIDYDEDNNIHVFLKRFKCLHWKRVKLYSNVDHNHVAKINYNTLPENFFIHHCRDNDNISLRSILSIIKNV